MPVPPPSPPPWVTLGTPASLWTAMCEAHHWNPKNEVLNTHHHADNGHCQSGGDAGGMARIQDTQSSLKHKSQQVPNALSSVYLQQPAPCNAYPFPGANSPVPLLLHPSYSAEALSWNFSPALTRPWCGQVHTFLGLLPDPGYTKGITHWLNDRAVLLTAYKWQTLSFSLDGSFQTMAK